MLKDKVALVTGGARGIGKKIAEVFGKNGATVIIIDLLEPICKSTVEEFENNGINASYRIVNVADYDAVQAMIKEIHKEYEHIDIIVNNAGITRDKLVLRMKPDEWQQVLDVNLTGTFNMIKSSASIMLKQRSGKIINISSVIGLIGNAGQANYAASKAGIIGLTKSIAKEFASRGIMVNAVAPGFIKTDMTDKLSTDVIESYKKLIPLNKMGTVEDVANVVLFLASSLSDYVTGQVINVDGGMVM